MTVTLKGSVQHKQKKKNKSYSPSPIAIQMVQGALSNREVKQHSKQTQLVPAPRARPAACSHPADTRSTV